MTGWQSKVASKPRKAPRVPSALEATLTQQFRAVLGPTKQPVSEFRFHPSRKWRFDFAWPDRKLAVEVEGGIWVNGRHGRGKGIEGDMEKYNQAAIMGWTVLRYGPGAVKDGTACFEVEQWLKN